MRTPDERTRLPKVQGADEAYARRAKHTPTGNGRRDPGHRLCGMRHHRQPHGAQLARGAVIYAIHPEIHSLRLPEPVVAKISQEILAEMIGTTRSRVSHFMNKFRKAGFIDYNGHLEVHSSLLSVVLMDPTRSVDLSADDRQPLR